MYKHATKHRHSVHAPQRRKHSRKSDIDKIKAYLWETTQGLQQAAGDRFSQSVDNVIEKSEEVHDYLAQRPVKTAGFSLATGLLIGACVGYFINDRYR